MKIKSLVVVAVLATAILFSVAMPAITNADQLSDLQALIASLAAQLNALQNAQGMPTITIVSPNGGETFAIGQPITVSFTTTLPVGTPYEVDLSTTGGGYMASQNGVVTNATIQTMAFAPNGAVVGNNYRFNVNATVKGVLFQDISDNNFTMVAQNQGYATLAYVFSNVAYTPNVSNPALSYETGIITYKITAHGGIISPLNSNNVVVQFCNVNGTCTVLPASNVNVSTSPTGSIYDGSTATVTVSATYRGGSGFVYFKISEIDYTIGGTTTRQTTGLENYKTPSVNVPGGVALVNGACGTANGMTYTVLPPDANLCAAGTSTPVTILGSGPGTWTCVGSNGGTTASCSAMITGVPPAQPSASLTMLTANVTYTPNVSNPALSYETGVITYKITAHGGIISALNSSNVIVQFCNVNGSCTVLPVSSVNVSTSPVGNIPDGSTATATVSATYRGGSGFVYFKISEIDYTINGTTTRQTAGLENYKTPSVNVPGGTVPSKTAGISTATGNLVTLGINGRCGFSNGTYTTTAPTTELCLSGEAGAVSHVIYAGVGGGWWWSCKGANGGTTADCSAHESSIADGVCGSANGVAVATAPTINLCSVGTNTAVTGSGPWTWSCIMWRSGKVASCSAPKTSTTSANVEPSNLASISAALAQIMAQVQVLLKK